MSDYRDDDQLNEEGQFSLESILKEFGSGAPAEEPPAGPAQEEETDWRGGTGPLPLRPQGGGEPPEGAGGAGSGG